MEMVKTEQPPTPVNFLKVCQQRERVFVAQWNVDDTVMSEDAYGVVHSHFLSASRSSCRHEDASVFTTESTRGPKTTG